MIWQGNLSFANVTGSTEAPEKGAVMASAKAVAQIARCIPAIAGDERHCATCPARQGCSLKSAAALWAF